MSIFIEPIGKLLNIGRLQSCCGWQSKTDQSDYGPLEILEETKLQNVSRAFQSLSDADGGIYAQRYIHLYGDSFVSVITYRTAG